MSEILVAALTLPPNKARKNDDQRANLPGSNTDTCILANAAVGVLRGRSSNHNELCPCTFSVPGYFVRLLILRDAICRYMALRHKLKKV